MNKFLKSLPALAFALAASVAFAFNMPLDDASSATKVWTPDAAEPHGYREVTSIVQEEEYDCNLSSNECLVEFSNDDPATGMKTILQDGDFQEQ
ncbi:DUF6520 family protein [Echinicola salinicaeni]|uniref:DUF6520 family protein n=1 Tax=Echinicola salinicaeni TaxID=2762757 RepID=UPI0016467175|nr:DUF6520 family protein [Echinicola salinicaeni]